MGDERIQTEHPDPDKEGVNIRVEIYDPVKAAILAAVDEYGEVAFGDLAAEVEARTDAAIWADASVGWYTTSVKLDLEARGLIERVPGTRPQRVRRRR